MSSPDNDVDPLTLRPIFEPESVPHDPAFAAADVRGAACPRGTSRFGIRHASLLSTLQPNCVRTALVHPDRHHESRLY